MAQSSAYLFPNVQAHSYQSPVPTNAAAAMYARNLQNWSTSTAPSSTPRAAHGGSRTQNRTSRSTRATPQPQGQSLQLHPSQYSTQYAYGASGSTSGTPTHKTSSSLPHQLPYSILKHTREQAKWSTYASRLRTGCTLLMQPIVSQTIVGGGSSSQAQLPQVLSLAASGSGPSERSYGFPGRPSRRAAAARNVSYIDQGSSAEDEPENQDEELDAGEKLDSEDEEFVVRRGARGNSAAGSRMGSTPTPSQFKDETQQSFLGQEPPERLVKWRFVPDGGHGHGARELFGEVNLGTNTLPPSKTSLIPISLSLNTPTHRIRDSFVWNIHENIVHPLGFARVMCQDLELDLSYAELIAAQIETQIEEHLEVASADVANDALEIEMATGERPECRVILSINVHIPPSQHLLDHIEWDLLSTLTPEEFAATFCAEVGLGGESVPLIAHALHEELLSAPWFMVYSVALFHRRLSWSNSR